MLHFEFPLARMAHETGIEHFEELMRPFGAFARGHSTFAPAVDVREDSDAIVLAADIPGVRLSDLKVTLDNGVLTIVGQRPEESPGKAATYHRLERRWGAFERQFALPAEADGAAIEATYDAGVLVVRVPKRPESRPKTIDIKVK